MIDLCQQPDVVPVAGSGKTLYAVRDEWRFEWWDILVIARPGYLFDGASIPRLLWPLGFTPDAPHRAAALAHDIGCEMQGLLVPGERWGTECEWVLLGSAVADDYQGVTHQLTHTQVHHMWADMLHQTQGQNPFGAWLKAKAVQYFGPRWKNKYPAPQL
jgi:hypothetical protein